ncbi:conserved hypothetical protein [uncultured Sporomusa sp.]|uniref:ATPase AAA-type core domain-containing protein n=1 Tax=uncultured Sporomusa sp. TaxID=307249 RepID=A0A212LYG7_9FIRM|nr:retron Eco8 family effector endonuclease [uncultured Sporomusa sp.]SCM82603.1 conserved hypothetical protein [uncultured Sporomusa sp.]
MNIVKLEIKNFKLISNLEINVKDINCLIGTNNTGKSSIMKAIYFVFCNLSEDIKDDTIFNKVNPFCQSLEINFYYDVKFLIEDDALLEYEKENADKIKALLIKYTNSRGILVLKFRRSKNGITSWNIPYELRLLLKRRFPIFFLESRNINLYEWDTLWQVVSRINPIRQRIDNDIYNKLDDNTNEILAIVKSVFFDNNIKIKDSNIFEKIELILQLYFGGKRFDTQSNSLKLDSFGQNSYSYIKVYLDLILRLFETKKLSMPLILLDEPEIHLHPQYIEKLSNSIFNTYSQSGKIKWFISTHSPTLIKNIIIQKPDTQILHISRKNFTPTINLMRDFRKNKGVQFMSDREANLFFSKASLFVEGETELEIFSNPKIIELYPVLKKYTIYNYDSKLDKLMLVHPREKKYQSKYYVILDMDKVLSYQNNINKFKSNASEKELNILNNEKIIQKQKLYYTDRYRLTYRVKKEIEAALLNNTFTLSTDNLTIIEKSKYHDLISLIQSYFFEFNTYPISTTIEGLVINESNINVFTEWLRTKVYNITLLDSLLALYPTTKEQSVFMRVLFMGKNDALQKDKNIVIQGKKISTIRLELMKKPKKQCEISLFRKNSGWITEYINWFFDNYMFGWNSGRATFSKYFPEMVAILKSL